MNFKQIKNYLIIALLIFSGLITLYNSFFGEAEDSTGEQLTVVEQTGTESNEVDEAADTNEQSDGSQIELAAVSETSTEEIQAEEITSSTTDQEQTDTNEAEETYNQALESINGYYDITSVEWLIDQDDYVTESYLKYAADGWYGLVDGQSYGTKAGGRWGNYDDQLPEYDEYRNEITYKEFDVNDKIDGSSRDAERFVVGSDGSVYYTYDHYDSFIKVIE